jgi:NADH-quinone oxidoreductase subunit L
MLEWLTRNLLSFGGISDSLWMIIALPLAGAFICGVFGRFLGRANTNVIACGTVLGSFLLSALATWAVGDQRASFISRPAGCRCGTRWRRTRAGGSPRGLRRPLRGLTVDRLTATVLLVITGVGFLIHLLIPPSIWRTKRGTGASSPTSTSSWP